MRSTPELLDYDEQTDIDIQYTPEIAAFFAMVQGSYFIGFD
jgi:hypothetical protein